jgi:two-component system, OmpR family, response regulator
MPKHVGHGAQRFSGLSAMAPAMRDRAVADAGPRLSKHPVQRSARTEPEYLGGTLSVACSPVAAEPAAGGARILVIHEDSAIPQSLVNYLSERSLSVNCSPMRQVALRAVSCVEPDLILLNDPIGRSDGFRLLKDIRSQSDAPILVTTGEERDEVDRIVALELGADDFLDRPVSPRELLARIRAILRRCETARNPVRRGRDRGGFRFAGWQLHRRSRRLIAPDGKAVLITKGEYALLIAFLSAPQRPLSREHLLRATRVHEDVFDRSIDVQVLRLRRKLEIHPAQPRFIQTERGVGYVFAIPVEAY